jgi:hypothetical protein
MRKQQWRLQLRYELRTIKPNSQGIKEKSRLQQRIHHGRTGSIGTTVTAKGRPLSMATVHAANAEG